MIIVNSCDDYKLRNEYNKMPGFISSEMSRVVVTPNSGMYTRILKNNMQLIAEEDAIQWSDCEWDVYWNEEGKIVIS